MNKHFMTVETVRRRVSSLATVIENSVPGTDWISLYGVPRGGVPVALALTASHSRFRITSNPSQAHFIVDDIIDSGHTQARYALHYPEKPFVALVNKKDNADDAALGWVVFPWEGEGDGVDNSIVGTIGNRLTSRRDHTGEGFGPADNVATAIFPGDREAWYNEIERRAQSFLDALLLDTTNPHLVGTAKRLTRMYTQGVCRGRYEPCPEATVFENTHRIEDPQVIGPITLRSLCAHHFCPIIGSLWVAYKPRQKLIGLSKFHRLSDWVASRPQVQEELTAQVADLLNKQIQPQALLVYVKASHTCVNWRGVRDHPEGAMVSVAFRGQTDDRSELLSLVQHQPD